VDAMLHEVRLALLEADVNYAVVKIHRSGAGASRWFRSLSGIESGAAGYQNCP